jgi:hypothetical protein
MKTKYEILRRLQNDRLRTHKGRRFFTAASKIARK